MAICSHLSNYLHSGLKKLLIDENPLSWTLESQTHYLVLITATLKQLPFTLNGLFLEEIYPILEQNVLLINSATVITQLLCMIAIFRITWIRNISIVYDIQHVIIFIVSGIFFWKWIWLNTTIIYACRFFNQNKSLQKSRSTIFLGSLLLIFSPSIFTTANLGWFETRSLNNAYFQAVTQDGTTYHVPTNFFGSFSVTAAQQHIFRKAEGHFRTSTLGNTQNRDVMLKAEKCLLETASTSGFSQEENVRKVSNFIKNHHRFVLENIDEFGKWNYDFYPHHMWSNLSQFEAFRNLDKRKIVKYIYVLDSVCLEYAAGNIVQKSVLRDFIEVEL